MTPPISTPIQLFDARVMRDALGVLHEIALDVRALVRLPSIASVDHGPELIRHAESLVRLTRPYAVRPGPGSPGPPDPPEAA